MGKTGPTYLEIGVIARPHGIMGEVKLHTSPEYSMALEGVKRVYLNDATTATRVTGYRNHQNAILLKLEGTHTRNDAEALRGARVSIKVSELPALAAGEYYSHQLVGMHVVDETGRELGHLSEVLATGSNDVYIVKTTDGKELLLPAIESVIRQVDLEHDQMSVVVPDGLTG
ncbi:MAG: ribosome maturation factor RimM [Chloroflexi bacterium]|nr:ribosome maturation factor RimM [Chloroflexota bacterium]MCL5273679.1 ribosome maturation factor RimM [Chloroflexota bacterium]